MHPSLYLASVMTWEGRQRVKHCNLFIPKSQILKRTVAGEGKLALTIQFQLVLVRFVIS